MAEAVAGTAAAAAAVAAAVVACSVTNAAEEEEAEAAFVEIETSSRNWTDSVSCLYPYEEDDEICNQLRNCTGQYAYNTVNQMVNSN